MHIFPAKISAVTIGLFSWLLVSCGSQPDLPKINGVKGPFFNVQDGKVLISVELERVSIPVGGSVKIDNMENSYLEVTPGQFGGTLFQVTLDMKDVENGDFRFLDPKKLPDGRELPGIVGGVLPSVAINVREWRDVTFYLSKRVFGFFLPTNLDKVSNLPFTTFAINMNKRHIGNLSLMFKTKDSDQSGLLLLLNLSSSGKAELQRLLNHSMKSQNRGRIY
jgi:hypothetical protein